MSDHVTDWSEDSTTAGFGGLDTGLWWHLGYAHLPAALELDRAVGSTVLDLGCGSGAVATWVVRSYPVDVLGVDPSAPMISEARAHAVPGTRYLHRPGDDTQLPTAAVSAAWAGFVFVCLPDLAAMRRVAAELARVVRPGGRIAILDSHPDTTGVPFGDLVQGEPDVRYEPGDPLPVWLRRTQGGWLKVTDTYWAADTYTEVLSDAGFGEIEHQAPTLELATVTAQQQHRWSAAAEKPPFLLVTARRHTGG